MEAARNEGTATWHLIGTRGCGEDPAGDRLEGTWAAIRDHVERDAGTKCRNCQWPRG
jgi:hypothetical protein